MAYRVPSVWGVVMVVMCAQLQAMVILSPPDKKTTESDMELLMNRDEHGHGGKRDVLQDLMWDEFEKRADPRTLADNIDLIRESIVLKGRSVKNGKTRTSSGRFRGEGSDEDEESEDRRTYRNKDDDSLTSTQFLGSNQAERDCGVTSGTVSPEADSLVLPAPERISRRTKRSIRRRPNPALRRASYSRRRSSERRSGDRRRRGRMARRKRDRVVKAVVELLVVVENSIYRKFLAKNHNNRQATLARIRRYYGIVVAMMDQRFQTIEDRRLSIGVRMSGIVVAETREDSGWMEALADWSKTAENNGRASVNTDKALFDFSQWIKARFSTLPKFDHAMVFSGYRLTNKYDISFGGKAYLNAICDVKNGNSVSIVSDKSDYQCVKVATHELAHSLGSVHDGDPGFENCPASGNYIMAPIASYEEEKLKYAFHFSSCSIRQMKKLLRSKKAACVRDAPTVYYKYDLQRMPPGQIISLDQHCELIYGSQSTFCNEHTLQADMCGQLWCRDPNMNGACRTNSYLTALPGTPCRKGMSCHLGQCLHNAIIEDLVNKANSRFTSSTATSSSSTTDSQRTVPGSTQSRLTGQRDLDNTILTVPQSVIRGRVGRPSRVSRVQQRRQHKSRSGRRRSRPRNKSRRKGRCKANEPDQNVNYCRGLISVNPEACKRRAILNYCCRTCAFRR